MAYVSTTVPRLADNPLVIAANQATAPTTVLVSGLLTNYDRPDANAAANTPTFTVTLVCHLFASATDFLTTDIVFPATDVRVADAAIATKPSTVQHIATERFTLDPTIVNVNTSSASLHWEGTTEIKFIRRVDTSKNLRFFKVLCWFHTPGSLVISPLPRIVASLTFP